MSIQTAEMPKDAAAPALETEEPATARQQGEGVQLVAQERDSQDKVQTTTAYSRQDAEKLLQQAKDYFGVKGINLHFKILQNSGDVLVEMMDAKSNKVIREIPKAELVNLSDNLRRMGKGFLDKAV